MTYPAHGALKVERNLPNAITLTGRNLEVARRLLALLSGHNEQATSSEPPVQLIEAMHAQKEGLREKARQILALRRKRFRRFSSAMFSEPAWEMLLNLYAAEGAGRLTVSGLTLHAGSSKATALRWIDYLEHQGLIEREAHPTDQRVAFVKLTEEGKETLGDYLSDVTELNGQRPNLAE